MTLGFNALGRMGRLCNQMFQYAAVKGISKNIGTDFCIPNHQHAVDDGIGNMQRTESVSYTHLTLPTNREV